MRILLIDDDRTVRLMLATLLKPYGECEEAADGEEAISRFTEALVQQRPFELVCLDIQMPGLDGHATLRCLRAIERGFDRDCLAGAKVLMATARETNQDILAAFREQAEGYLVKPIDPAQLRAQLVTLGLESF